MEAQGWPRRPTLGSKGFHLLLCPGDGAVGSRNCGRGQGQGKRQRLPAGPTSVQAWEGPGSGVLLLHTDGSRRLMPAKRLRKENHGKKQPPEYTSAQLGRETRAAQPCAGGRGQGGAREAQAGEQTLGAKPGLAPEPAHAIGPPGQRQPTCPATTKTQLCSVLQARRSLEQVPKSAAAGKCRQRHLVNEQVWPCANKTLFMNKNPEFHFK